MRFRDYLALATRSLRRSRLRSGLTIAAIVIGATGITIMLTFVTSVKSYVVNQYTQTGQIRQIQVAQSQNLSFGSVGDQHGGQSTPGAPTLTPATEATIAALPHVAGVSAAYGNSSALQYLAYGNKKLQPNVVGIQPSGVIVPTLVAGRGLEASDQSDVVLLTQDYANALGFSGTGAAAVGHTVSFHTQQGYTGAGATLPSTLPPQQQCSQGQNNCNGGPASGLPALDLPARVVGVVSSSYDTSRIYMPLAWSIGISNQAEPRNVIYPQNRNSGPNNPPNTAPTSPGTVEGGWVQPTPDAFVANNGGYSSLIVEADDSANVASVASSINRLGFGTATGISQLDKQKQAANIIALVLGGLGLVALGIAALGVMNTMVMSVLERTREIGVMRALGARRSTIRRLFTFEASALGFLGGLFGVIIGYVVLLVAKPIISHAVKFPSNGAPSFSVPVWLIVLVIVVTTLIGFVSGLLPSRRAARLDPIEALRYE